ncbi:type II secretion system F family protein [Atopobium fossor]|uniref:type II secretion system F family protein n=1 Tax=Atopobium fossor TaxID=39487 RepID=UPI000685F0C7|nr:type II secretion system F family protein [Atopobium fossor]
MEAIMLAGAIAVTGAGVFACIPRRFIGHGTSVSSTGYLSGMTNSLSKTPTIVWFSQQQFFLPAFKKTQQMAETYGYILSIPHAAAVYAIIVSVVCAAFLILFGPALGILFALGGVVGSTVWLTHKQKVNEIQSIQQQMPEILRSLSVALQSGKTLFQAMEYIGAHAQGQLSKSFAIAALSLRCGVPMQEVLGQLNESLSVPGGELLAIALEISQRTGSPLGEILATSSRMVEQREKLARLLRTKTAQARLSVKIVCGLPFLMLLVLSAISQDFRQGLFTIQGVVCIAISLTLDGIALLIVKKMMQGISQ